MWLSDAVIEPTDGRTVLSAVITVRVIYIYIHIAFHRRALSTRPGNRGEFENRSEMRGRWSPVRDGIPSPIGFYYQPGIISN